MNSRNLLSELALQPLICDGAMGTQLFAKGLRSGDCGMLWNVERPELVQSVHAAYLQAGCRLITTNTFVGSTYSLERHGLASRMAELNRAGARNAREIAGEKCWVMGDVGPFGDFLEPLGDTTPEELAEIFQAQVAALEEGGVDAILVETMSDPAEMEIAVSAAKAAASLPVVATYSFQRSGEEFRTMLGSGVEETVRRAIAAGADVIGTNCGTELAFADYLKLAREIVRAAGKTPVIIQPNAGSPQIVDGQTTYIATPQEMAAIVNPLIKEGVAIVGGCCGTTPAHLAEMRRVLVS